MAFPLLSATGQPGDIARLSKCCRAFRTIFSDEDIWRGMCKRANGPAGEPSSWRRAYRDWALSAQSFFTTYVRMLREIGKDPSFGIRIEFHGEDLPEAWREEECMRAEEVKVGDFGVFLTMDLYWSDMHGHESLSPWDYELSRRISCIRVLADYRGKSGTVLEVDASETGGCALDFAKLDVVRDAGMEVWHNCHPEDDPEDEDYNENYAENLGFRMRLPTVRVLEALLGAEEMKAAAAERIGRSLRATQFGQGCMLFGDVRLGKEALATVGGAWPMASALPMPGYKFSFGLATSRVLQGHGWWHCASSLWCLDACGNTAFACCRAPLRPGKEFSCAIRSGPRVTPSTLRHCLACDWQPVVTDEESQEVVSFHIFMASLLQLPSLEGGRLLRAAVADCARQAARPSFARAFGAPPQPGGEEVPASR